MNRKYLMETEFIRHVTYVDNGDPQDRPEIGIIWDTFKAYIRGMMLGYVAKKKANLDNEINKLKEQISILERKHKIQASRI